MLGKLRGQSGARQQIDTEEASRALRLLVDPSYGVQLQGPVRWEGPRPIFGVKNGPGSDIPALVLLAEELAHCRAIYVMLNPVPLGMTGFAKNTDIIERRWLFIDIDPIRPDKSSSDATDEEHERARASMYRIRQFLAAEGWPAPLLVDSGNGFYLLYRISLPNSEHARALCQAVVRVLAGRFDEPGLIDVDTSVFDAKRIARLPGTWNCKGPGTEERPHRRCRIVEAPVTLGVVPVEALQRLAASPEPAAETVVDVPAPPPPRPKKRGNLDPIPAYRGVNVLDRAIAYLGTIDTAYSGQYGSDPTMWAARVVCWGYDLGEARGLELLLAHYNPRCVPPWSEAELSHKCADACKAEGFGLARGWLLRDEGGNGKAPKVKAAPLDPAEVVTYCASEVTPKKVEWLWPGRIPLGKLTTFAGVGGLGKTFVLCDITARVSRGLPWPDAAISIMAPSTTLFVSGEDEADDTLVPRLIELGADLSRVRFLTTEVADRFTLGDLAILERAMEEADGECRFVAIDPPTAYLGGADDHKNAELRALLSPLKSWSARHRVAIVFNTHVNKAQGKIDAMMRVMGSVAWVNAVRAAHMFARDPDEPERRVFVPMKMNVGKERRGLAYKLTEVSEDMAKVEWLGEVDTTADQAVNAERGKKKRAVKAAEWLAELFGQREEVPSKEIFRRTQAETTISDDALREAKEDLGIRAFQKCDGNGKNVWHWHWPASARNRDDDPDPFRDVP